MTRKSTICPWKSTIFPSFFPDSPIASRGPELRQRRGGGRQVSVADAHADLASGDGCVSSVYSVYMAVCQDLVPLVNIKIAGKWMFIPLKMVLIGIDPYPY